MKTKSFFLILLLSLLIISCKKETFPDNEDLKGNWTATTMNKDQESLSFDGEQTLIYAKFSSRALQLDTLIYGLDKKQEKLYLSPKGSPNSESAHKILLDLESGELTIWGLHSAESESKFIKQ